MWRAGHKGREGISSGRLAGRERESPIDSGGLLAVWLFLDVGHRGVLVHGSVKDGGVEEGRWGRGNRSALVSNPGHRERLELERCADAEHAAQVRIRSRPGRGRQCGSSGMLCGTLLIEMPGKILCARSEFREMNCTHDPGRMTPGAAWLQGGSSSHEEREEMLQHVLPDELP